MIQKHSYGFNTSVALCIGEIQEATNPSDWYWVDGKLNISDWLTGGKSPRELGEDNIRSTIANQTCNVNCSKGRGNSL